MGYFRKVDSASLTHCKPDPNQSKTVNLYQLVSSANRIVNHDGITYPDMTVFKDPPEEGYLADLDISQEEMHIVIDIINIGLLAGETTSLSN